jgi:energy-coupling factor transporter ATP-binding protein EcfA2
MGGSSVPDFGRGGLSPFNAGEAARDLIEFSSLEETRFGTGWAVDDICGRIGTGEMALMWARSGSGKSTWTLNLIANTPDVSTLVVNMEMTPRRQIDWLAAMSFDLPVPGRDVEELLRYPDDPRYPVVVEALDAMGEKYPNLHFARPDRPTVSDLHILLDDIEDATGQKVQRVFIDHLSLMGGCEGVDYSGHIRTSDALHSFTMERDVATVVLQQVGRGGGDLGRNDGHLPITFSSGVFGGEASADWVYGLYRPDRDPRFRRNEHQFKGYDEYLDMRAEFEKVRGLVVMQVIKNRPFGDTCEDGVQFQYDPYTRRFREIGVK